MTIHYRTQGVVFKKQDRLEADRIFSVFTQDFGRLEILARAVRKIISKLRGGIEIFSLSELEFIQGKNQKTLTDAVLIEKFKNITGDLEKFAIANKITDVLDSLIKGQEKDEHVWNLILDTFERLNYCKLKIENSLEIENWKLEIIYYYFLWNFLSVLGYSPELSKCAFCQKKLNPLNLYFSCKEGGIICNDCLGQDKDALKVSPDVVKILRLILQKDWLTLSKIRLEETAQDLLKEISEDYYDIIKKTYYE